MKAKTWGGNFLDVPVPIGQPHVLAFISATAVTALNRPAQPPMPDLALNLRETLPLPNDPAGGRTWAVAL
jgi:hypothetical protein